MNKEEGRWVMECLLNVINNNENEFWKSMRTVEGRLMVQKQQNRSGVFLRISKVEYGKVKNIVVPVEAEKGGWRALYRELRETSNKASNEENKATYFGKEAREEIPTYRDGKRGIENKEKDWRYAVGIMSSVDITWKEVADSFTKILGRRCSVYAFGVDRAVLWCITEEERRIPLNTSFMFTGRRQAEWIHMSKWSKEFQRKEPKIYARSSWVGIEGLPLKMWNGHVFNVLGAFCGGLEAVAA